MFKGLLAIFKKLLKVEYFGEKRGKPFTT